MTFPIIFKNAAKMFADNTMAYDVTNSEEYCHTLQKDL